MRLLAVSDIHGEEAAIESIKTLSQSHDATLVCGDLTHSTLHLEDLERSVENLFIIPGNWDSERINKRMLESPRSAHMKRHELPEGLNLVGFGLTPPTPFSTFGEMSEDEMQEGLRNLEIDERTILMLHCPPRGYFDLVRGGEHVGSESVLWTIEKRKPLLSLFGHVHEHLGVARMGESMLVKLPPGNSMRACSLTVTGRDVKAEYVIL